MLDRILAPAGSQGRNEIVHAPAAGSGVDSHGHMLFHRPAHTQPDDGQPPGAELVDRGQAIGELGGPVIPAHQDARAQLHASRPGGHRGQQLGRGPDRAIDVGLRLGAAAVLAGLLE